MGDLTLGAFYGIDSIIDFLVATVAILIFYQSNKVYKILKERKYLYFSWGFFSIALAYIAKIFANVTAIHKVIIHNPNFLVPLMVEFKRMQLIHFTSFFLFKFFLLIGFLTLFLVTKKISKKEELPILAYLSIIALLFSIYFNFIFHLTLVIILAILTGHFYDNYKRCKSQNSYFVFLGFAFILASQFIDMFYGFHLTIYLISELIVFIGFILLLLNHLKLKNGKEKNKTRGDKRPSRNLKERKSS